MKQAILATMGLAKTYTSQGVVTPVIQSLDLRVEQGSFSIIMGSSGSGKSSLLYLAGGMDRPDGGQISIAGQRIDDRSETELAHLRREQIGFVFQDFNLIPHLTFLENILVPGYLSKEPRRQVRERGMQLLERMGIAQLADRRPSQASGGEQQRGAVARALINKPRLLLADEPTGNLDSSASENMLDLFEELNREGQTIVMVTHELKAAVRGQRVCYLRDGVVVDQYDFGQVSRGERERALFAWLSQRGW